MRSRTRSAVALVLLVGFGAVVQADGPEEVRAKRLRDQLPAIDTAKLDEVVAKGMDGDDEVLAGARGTVDRVRETILKKWRTVGRLNLANAYSEYSQHFKAAENAMAVWAKEQDRRIHLEEIDRRQAEEWETRYGKNPDASAHRPGMDRQPQGRGAVGSEQFGDRL